ncbi:MAG TPA: DUF2339 domain-containing protein [Salinarimonas sp.]|nr:DUF2339 domain-containing protein [Salinarimonas sp.]
MEFLLIALAVVAIPAMAIAGFVLALNLRERTQGVERRLAALEAELALLRAGPAAAAAGIEPRQELEPEPEPIVGEPPPFPEAPAAEPAPIPDPPPVVQPAPARPGLEELLGARWAVWVGGVALALGGVFLVRYSIEQGLLGPGARTLAGALFALALLAAGEVLRRRGAPDLPGLSGAAIPAVLTGAGVSSAFATAYAAHALYGLVGPGPAFVLMGAIAVLTMLAASLHGPALAALGLVGALACPLLVESSDPQIWPLVIYLAFVGAAAYGVARLRLWPWLARSAAVGGALWGGAFLGSPDIGPQMAHALLQVALASLFLLVDPYRGASDAESRPDRLAAGALLAFAALGVVVTGNPAVGDARAGFALALMALLLVTAIRVPAGAPAAAWAALVGVGTLALWPVRAEIEAAPILVLPPVIGPAAMPEAVTAFLGFGIAAAVAVSAAGLWRIARGPTLPLSTAGWFAGAATLGPLACLAVAWARVEALETSVPFALAAGGLGLAFTGAAAILRRREGESLDAVRLGVGAAASAAVAALALGLAIALERGTLTVALALAALGTAWVADRTRIAPLRWVVAAIGILVLARLAWDPRVVGPDLGTRPILNWLLWGYGVPALAFLAASRILDRTGRDWVARLAESLALVLGALLAFLQIRHAVTGGDMLRQASDHLEIGLAVTVSLGFAWLLARVDAVRPDAVSRVGGIAFGAIGLGLAGLGLGLAVNPLFSGEPVLGGPVINSLAAAYLLPALLAGALALAARGHRPGWYVAGAAALGLALLVAYATLAIRRAFQGPEIGIWRSTSPGELWTYSAALVAIGAALLAVGLWRGWREARLASAVVIAAAVVKVFLVDLANLEGALRAFSFIGLGLALVGVGLAYQRLLARPAATGGTPS